MVTRTVGGLFYYRLFSLSSSSLPTFLCHRVLTFCLLLFRFYFAATETIAAVVQSLTVCEEQVSCLAMAN